MFEDRVLTESGKKTKDQIFNAAVKLLLKDGYDKLTIKKICEASGEDSFDLGEQDLTVKATGIEIYRTDISGLFVSYPTIVYEYVSG